MRKVDQTLFGAGKGNCFAACVATLLGEQLVNVPNFCAEYGEVDWYGHFSAWLNARGFAPLTCAFSDEAASVAHLDWAQQIAPGIPWIACGDTERGKHAVVYVGRELFHDPNPNFGRSGVRRVEDATFFLSRVISGEQQSC